MVDSLGFPSQDRRVFLHVCCAPCSGGIMECLLEASIQPLVFFFNPNIFPQGEYEKRKMEVIRFLDYHKIPFMDGDYEHDSWVIAVRGMENEPERGKRCEACFEYRLKRTACEAVKHSFPVFGTTLGISRWKDLDQVNRAGIRAALSSSHAAYWPCNWRNNGGQERMRKVIQREGFYQQKYCGCEFSMRSPE